MVLEQRRREQNGKRTTQAVAGQPDLLRHALAASRGGDEPPTNAAPWKAEQEVGALLQPVSGALAPYRPSQRYHLGADTADRLSGMLAGISDPERLAEVGEWLVRCDSGEEFLARVESHGPRDS
jgi:hypothetical protein